MTDTEIAEKVSWKMPFNAYQKVGELAGMLKIIRELQPKVILEIGSHHGGTAWAMRQVAPNAHMICVDSNILDKSFSTGEALIALGVGCDFLEGNSQIQETLNKVKAIAPVVDFLFLDADHSAEGIRADWELYSQLVPPGGIIAFHDIKDGIPTHGVYPLWKELQEKYTTEEIWADPLDWGGIGILIK